MAMPEQVKGTTSHVTPIEKTCCHSMGRLFGMVRLKQDLRLC